MGMQSGIDATVKLGTTTVVNFANWSFTDMRDPISVKVFDKDHVQVIGMGVRGVTGSVSGYLDTSDSTGQMTLETAALSGSSVSDFRLYINSTEYYKAPTVYIHNYNVEATIEDTPVPISFDFTVHNSWTRF